MNPKIAGYAFDRVDDGFRPEMRCLVSSGCKCNLLLRSSLAPMVTSRQHARKKAWPSEASLFNSGLRCNLPAGVGSVQQWSSRPANEVNRDVHMRGRAALWGAARSHRCEQPSER